MVLLPLEPESSVSTSSTIAACGHLKGLAILADYIKKTSHVNIPL